MKEINFDKEKINNLYELSDAKIRKLKILRDALLRSINSNRENIEELASSKEKATSDTNRNSITHEIELHRNSISKSEKLLGKYEEEIAKWEEKLKGIATNILEDFEHDDLKPN